MFLEFLLMSKAVRFRIISITGNVVFRKSCHSNKIITYNEKNLIF